MKRLIEYTIVLFLFVLIAFLPLAIIVGYVKIATCVFIPPIIRY